MAKSRCWRRASRLVIKAEHGGGRAKRCCCRCCCYTVPRATATAAERATPSTYRCKLAEAQSSAHPLTERVACFGFKISFSSTISVRYSLRVQHFRDFQIGKDIQRLGCRIVRHCTDSLCTFTALINVVTRHTFGSSVRRDSRNRPSTHREENTPVTSCRSLSCLVIVACFPEAKATRAVAISFAETKNISSAGTSSRGGARKKNGEYKTGKDVREISGEEPTRSEGRLVEITNTWRDVKRALSLLCIKTFSSSAAMLEAPPGSREDLVEAARTPCTPTDLDTMLYGYTNSIYVLDHTPESLPDMDMLQLFASPAGRALVTGDNRPTTRGGSTSTSLSRESSSRAKSSRRTSSAFGVPTPPPRQRKSSTELYKEAVEILGLTCSLTDSCRCLDCQSNYFDCDDDCGDPRSELAAGTPILLDHALSHPLTCSIQ